MGALRMQPVGAAAPPILSASDERRRLAAPLWMRDCCLRNGSCRINVAVRRLRGAKGEGGQET